MRQGPHVKRGRGRGNRRSNVPNRNQTFDSNGPDVRIRGNAHQVYEKYLSLARDATTSGDRVLAESCYQYAEHYFRILKTFADEADESNRTRAASGQRSGGDAAVENQALSSDVGEDMAASEQPAIGVEPKLDLTEPSPDAAPPAEIIAAGSVPTDVVETDSDDADQLPAFVSAPQAVEETAQPAPKPRRRQTVRIVRKSDDGDDAKTPAAAD